MTVCLFGFPPLLSFRDTTYLWIRQTEVGPQFINAVPIFFLIISTSSCLFIFYYATSILSLISHSLFYYISSLYFLLFLKKIISLISFSLIFLFISELRILISRILMWIFYISPTVYFGEGNGNPPQYSCLENPMEGRAWQATVHGVAKVVHNLATKPPPLST